MHRVHVCPYQLHTGVPRHAACELACVAKGEGPLQGLLASHDPVNVQGQRWPKQGRLRGHQQRLGPNVVGPLQIPQQSCTHARTSSCHA
jgi:hypothetical protein